MLFTLAAMVSSVAATAMSEDSLSLGRDSLTVHRIEVDAVSGLILHTNAFLRGNNPEVRTMNHSFMGRLKYAFAPPENSVEARVYKGVYQGVGLGFHDFNPQLGHPVSLFIFQGATIKTLAPRLSLNYEWNFGVTYGWKAHDWRDNPENRVIGSKMTAYIDADLYLRWMISKNWDLNVGATITHYSNGNTAIPNAGLNVAGARASVAYYFNRSGRRPATVPLPAFKRHWGWDLTLYGAWKKKGVSAPKGRPGFSWFRKAPLPQAVTADAATTIPDTDAFLSVQNLRVSFTVLRGASQTIIQSVRGLSFKMQRGEILGIVGESGSGKSVTTTAIPALHPSNATVEGKIFFEGLELTALSQKEMRSYRGKKIGLIFQEPGRSFDPLQNMGSVFFETFRNSNPQISRQDSDKKAVELLTEVGLPDPESRLKNYPHQFSGGQLQRIGIALALAQGCELLIADEPTTALDVTIQAQIVALLADLREKRKLSIIFISHNIELVAGLCDNIIVMYGGLIMESGSSEEIMQRAKHPYTQALLASSPKFGTHYSSQRLTSIPGRVTDPAHPEPGCPFAPRCQYAKDVCKKTIECYKQKEE